MTVLSLNTVSVFSIGFANVNTIVVSPTDIGEFIFINGSGGGGGTEYVVSGVAVIVDSAGRVYTVNADTSVLSTHDFFYNKIDSLAATIPAQFNPIAGTNMSLTGTYPNITFNATGGGSGSVEYVVSGYGIIVDSAARVYTVRADTTTLDTRYTQVGDSTIFGAYAPFVWTQIGDTLYGGVDTSTSITGLTTLYQNSLNVKTVTSANADITVSPTTINPVITMVQAPALININSSTPSFV